LRCCHYTLTVAGPSGLGASAAGESSGEDAVVAMEALETFRGAASVSVSVTTVSVRPAVA
jgi:hypothetical protein